MPTLLSTPYWSLELDPQRRIVRVRRTSEPLPSLDVIDRDRAAIHAALAGLDRSRYGLLSDLRDGPLRSDPEFEHAIRALREELYHGFPRSAALVRTAVGRLQLSRIARETPGAHDTFGVFQDEAEALAWLAHPHPAHAASHARR